MAEPGIDPRYAAQFQRGFDPAVHAPVKERRGPAPISSGAPPVVRRVPDPPAAVERPVAHVAPAAATPVEQPLPASRPRSEWALLGVGIGLFALAGWLFWAAIEAQTMYQGVGPEFSEQLFYYAADRFPGPLLVGGVVAIVLWIVLRAVRLPRGEA